MEDASSTFWESMGANGVLILVFVVYKLANRLLGSKCKYTKDGLEFDLDGTECPVTDLDKIGDLLKQRSMIHRSKLPPGLPPKPPPNLGLTGGQRV